MPVPVGGVPRERPAVVKAVGGRAGMWGLGAPVGRVRGTVGRNPGTGRNRMSQGVDVGCLTGPRRRSGESGSWDGLGPAAGRVCRHALVSLWPPVRVALAGGGGGRSAPGIRASGAHGGPPNAVGNRPPPGASVEDVTDHRRRSGESRGWGGLGPVGGASRNEREVAGEGKQARGTPAGPRGSTGKSPPTRQQTRRRALLPIEHRGAFATSELECPATRRGAERRVCSLLGPAGSCAVSEDGHARALQRGAGCGLGWPRAGHRL